MQVLHYDPMTHYYAHHDWIGYEANEERQHWASVRKVGVILNVWR